MERKEIDECQKSMNQLDRKIDRIPNLFLEPTVTVAAQNCVASKMNIYRLHEG